MDGKNSQQQQSPYNGANRPLSSGDVTQILNRFNVTLKHRNTDLYRQAFVHRSYCVRKNESVVDGNAKCPDGCMPLQPESNERLEFLGDAVINLVVANYLYRRYPDDNEGFMTRIRTKLVNGTMLASLSEAVGFHRHLVISKQVESNAGRMNSKLLEDCFEAFVGAMYTDFNCVRIKSDKLGGCGIGYQVVEQWLVGLLEDIVDFSELISFQENHKERLIRFMQSQFGQPPRFAVVSEADGAVTVAVRHGNEVISTASADTRKGAESLAAIGALKYLGAMK